MSNTFFKLRASLQEEVRVKKTNFSWGNMITVHHGIDNSFPLHPEHQEAIKNLKSGETTSFKDETNRMVTASREGSMVYLSGRGSHKKTPVAHSHFTEDNKLPFIPDKPKKTMVVPGKHGVGPSTVKHLAKMAMKKEKDKREVREDSEVAFEESEETFKKTFRFKPIQNSFIKTSQGHTFVGSTNDDQGRKGANIYKHKNGGYFASPGSLTRQEGDIHKTAELAASAFHNKRKEKLAEEHDMVVDEGLRSKLAAGALAATMALGTHARVSADHQDDPHINRLTGKPHVTQTAEKPAETPTHRDEKPEKVERHGLNHGDAITIHYGGKEYKGFIMPHDGPRMRGGKVLTVPQAMMGIRGLGHYEAQIHPSGHAAIYK